MICDTHKRYRGMKRPSGTCKVCWEIWFRSSRFPELGNVYYLLEEYDKAKERMRNKYGATGASISVSL